MRYLGRLPLNTLRFRSRPYGWFGFVGYVMPSTVYNTLIKAIVYSNIVMLP